MKMKSSLFFSAFALALALASARSEGGEVKKKIYGTNTEIVFDLENYRPEKGNPGPQKYFIYGTIGQNDQLAEIKVSAVSRSNVSKTSAEWRAEFCKSDKKLYGNAAMFECGGTAALLVEAGDAVIRGRIYHGFVLVEGYCLNVQIKTLELGPMLSVGKDDKNSKDPWSQAEVCRILQSIYRFDKKPPTFPKSVGAFLEEMAKHGPDPVPWIREQCQANPEAYEPHFVLGEMSFLKKDAEGCIQGYSRSSELLLAKKTLDRDEKFALGMSEDGLSWALHTTKKDEEALTHARKAYDIAVELQLREARGERAYNLACLYATLKDASNALPFLKEAIGIDRKYREVAKKDEDFASIRENPEFLKLVNS